MAKVAVAFSGLARLYRTSVESWKKIIDRYDADVYVHTWSDDPGAGPRLTGILNHAFKPESIMISRSLKIDTSPFPDRHWPCISVYNSLSMWHSVRFAHQLVRNSGVDYDIIIRGRTDHWIEDLELMDYDGVVIPYDEDKHPLKFTYRGMEMHGLNDLLAYGQPHWMDRYVETLDLILPLYRDEQVDYCPENFLAASLHRNSVPLYQQQMNQALIRG